MYRIIIALFFATIIFKKTFGQKNIQLVANGKSNYTIVIPEHATGQEKKAADTLQQYITKISKCVLPVSSTSAAVKGYQIIIGRNSLLTPQDTAGLGSDGILIKQVQNNLILTGGSRRGILYSVFTLLEDYLGCQVYTATDIEIPKKGSLRLPARLYKKFTPSFSNRMTLYLDAYDYKYSDWRKLTYYQEGWGLWVHSFEVLLPKDKYFSSHPEYYALRDGQRKPSQPDLTNPEVLQIVIENLEKIIKKKPDYKYFSVSQNDNGGYCQCENCTKLDKEQNSHQGSLLTFVNAVARHFPDKTITTLAYEYSEKPPLTLRPEKNVMVMLCTGASKDRRIPLANYTSLPFYENFKTWSSLCDNLFLWDYIAQYDHLLLPFPNLTALQPNIRYFASRNVYYLFEQGIADNVGEFSELKCYLVSKLMWNKDLNVNAAQDSFLNHYYGPVGAVYVRRYINMLERNVRASNTPVEHFGNLDKPLKTYLSPADLSVYKSIFKQALDKVDTSSTYGKRILKEYTCVLYAELEGNKLLLSQENRSSAFNKKEYLSRLDDWYKDVKAIKLNYLTFAKLTADSYYKRYLALINSK